MAAALLAWQAAAPADELRRARPLLAWAAARAGASERPGARRAAGALAAGGMRPAALAAARDEPAAAGGGGGGAAVARARADRDEIQVMQARARRGCGRCKVSACGARFPYTCGLLSARAVARSRATNWAVHERQAHM